MGESMNAIKGGQVNQHPQSPFNLWQNLWKKHWTIKTKTPSEKDITNISMERCVDLTYDIRTCFCSGLPKR